MKVFFLMMLLGSGLSLLKMLVLAQVMEGAAFGDYVSIVGVAMLSAGLLSFGAIEGTVKRYPRLWVAGQRGEIRASAIAIAWRMGLRFASLAMLLAAINDWAGWSYGRLDVVAGVMFGLGAAMQALMASVLRAVDRASALAWFSLSRSALAFAAALAGALLAGWEGALMGEVLACGLSLVQGRWIARRAYRDIPDGQAGEAEDVSGNQRDGVRLYAANTLSSVTSLADRAFVNVALGAVAAGSYGVLAMIFQVGQLLVSILTQRLGAVFIKASYTGDTGYDAVRKIWLVFGGLVIVVAGMTSGLLLLAHLNWPAELFEKYLLTPLSIMLAGGVSVLQIYLLIEYYLLSKDQEGGVLLASAVSAALVVGLFIFGLIRHCSLDWYIGSVLLAKLVQVAILLSMGKTRR